MTEETYILSNKHTLRKSHIAVEYVAVRGSQYAHTYNLENLRRNMMKHPYFYRIKNNKNTALEYFIEEGFEVIANFKGKFQRDTLIELLPEEFL